MSKILLVEDDESLGATLKSRLQMEGYVVVLVRTVKDAKKEFMNSGVDLMIVDIGLPDGSGLEFTRSVRYESNTPFIFLTAMNSPDFRLEGFEIGADDYIPKPFHLQELLLRIKRVLESRKVPNVLQLGEFSVNLDTGIVTNSNGDKETLIKRDVELFKLLYRLAPKVVSREEILKELWAGQDVTERTIDNAIVRIRKVLGLEKSTRLKSVRGVGYQWNEE